MKIATEVARRLAETRCRIVFAESCTCGMVACELGKIPGVSNWLCGSAVTYRNDTKIHWLGVDAADIETHTAVSDQVARQMAVGVLERTLEADLSASITGHFGPDAPDKFDGVVFIGLAKRHENGTIEVQVNRYQLKTAERTLRQIEATECVLQVVMQSLLAGDLSERP